MPRRRKGPIGTVAHAVAEPGGSHHHRVGGHQVIGGEGQRPAGKVAAVGRLASLRSATTADRLALFLPAAVFGTGTRSLA